MKKIQFITNSETKQTYYKAIIENETFSTSFITKNYDDSSQYETDACYLFIDLDEISDIKTAVEQSQKIKDVKIALISNIADPDKIHDLIDCYQFELILPKKHILESKEEVAATQDIIFLFTLLKSNHFQIDNDEVFPNPQTIELTNINEKTPTIDTICENVQNHGYKPAILEKINLILDELITNAVFHAPVDKNGTSKYTNISRDKSFKLAENETVTVKYSISDEHVIFKVIDNFGTLTWDKFNSYIKNALNFMKNSDLSHLKGQVGGGIGLCLLFLMSHYLLLRVIPGERTEFTVILKNVKRRRDLINKPKLMYFYDFGK